MQRNLFVVPREAVGGEETNALEAAAAADPAAKKQLLAALHVSAGKGSRAGQGASTGAAAALQD